MTNSCRLKNVIVLFQQFRLLTLRYALLSYAGDERVNENVPLTSMHTLWTREHNSIEQQLQLINPHWDGETLFQETRKIVVALFQHVVINEFLPTILGPEFMRRFDLEPVKHGYYTGAICEQFWLIMVSNDVMLLKYVHGV